MKTTAPATFQQRITTLFNRHRLRCDAAGERFTRELYARRIGATLGMLRGWMSGSGEPSTEALARIARVENVSVDWLVGASDDELPVPAAPENSAFIREIAGADPQTLSELEQYFHFLEYQNAKTAGGK